MQAPVTFTGQAYHAGTPQRITAYHAGICDTKASISDTLLNLTNYHCCLPRIVQIHSDCRQIKYLTPFDFENNKGDILLHDVPEL